MYIVHTDALIAMWLQWVVMSPVICNKCSLAQLHTCLHYFRVASIGIQRQILAQMISAVYNLFEIRFENSSECRIAILDFASARG